MLWLFPTFAHIIDGGEIVLSACMVVSTYLKKMKRKHFLCPTIVSEIVLISSEFPVCVYSVGVFDIHTKAVCYFPQT